jgi:hypothetical protein
MQQTQLLLHVLLLSLLVLRIQLSLSAACVFCCCCCHFLCHCSGGLTENDFIIAALINDIDLSQLLQKRKARFWA